MLLKALTQITERSLTQDEIKSIMHEIMAGEMREEDVEFFLVALAKRGETPIEIAGAAEVLREKSLKIKAPNNAIDCCGTGGDNIGTYNISTAVAIICAASGIAIAKHGNRASSSQSGAADVLEALEINLNVSQETLEKALQEINFAFLMAPHHHKSMKHVAHIRKKIGHRTIFNLLGPLINPAQANRQLLGVFEKQWVLPMAQTLQKLGCQKAWVVHGGDGLDEITLTDNTHVAILDNDTIIEKTVSPEDFGLPFCSLEDLQGGSAITNAKALQDLLEGRPSAYRDIVCANSAAVLCIHEDNIDLKQAVKKIQKIIDQGLAKDTLDSYRAFVKNG